MNRVWVCRGMGAVLALFSGVGLASDRIVGGVPVEAGDPVAASTAALAWEDLVLCSATVLDHDLLLTAAHCLGLPDQVVFGVDARDPEAPKRKILAVLPHPNWDLSRHDEDPVPRGLSDIAVIRIEGGLPPGVRPALLADESHPLGDEILIAGFGVNDAAEESGAGVLRQARVRLKDRDYDPSEFQIDASQGAGDCSGDSGGPAFSLEGTKARAVMRMHGVDNWGEGQCDRFGVYARVSFHRAWIEDAMRELRAGGGLPVGGVNWPPRSSSN